MFNDTRGRHLAVKVAMMPRDTNPHGVIFGGVLLSYIDQAGAIGALHDIRTHGWRERPIVTVAMDGVVFHQPVFVGDVLSFWTELISVGTTSITVQVTVEADRGGEVEMVTKARVTYVAVEFEDGQRRPTPIRDEDRA